MRSRNRGDVRFERCMRLLVHLRPAKVKRGPRCQRAIRTFAYERCTSLYKLVLLVQYAQAWAGSSGNEVQLYVVQASDKLACRCSSTLYAQANVHACSSL